MIKQGLREQYQNETGKESFVGVQGDYITWLEDKLLQSTPIDWDGLHQKLHDWFYTGLFEKSPEQIMEFLKQQNLSVPVKELTDPTIDTVGKCANCGVEYHIHKEMADVVKELTENKETLINFLDSIRDYERESHNLIGFDERESSEFVDQFLLGRKERG